MSIRKVKGLYFVWDVVFAIMVLITYKEPAYVFPFFVINGFVLVLFYSICNANIRKAIKQYRLEHPCADHLSADVNENLRYHRSAHPEIKKFIDERSSLFPYAIVNIFLMIGMMINV